MSEITLEELARRLELDINNTVHKAALRFHSEKRLVYFTRYPDLDKLMKANEALADVKTVDFLEEFIRQSIWADLNSTSWTGKKEALMVCQNLVDNYTSFSFLKLPSVLHLVLSIFFKVEVYLSNSGLGKFSGRSRRLKEFLPAVESSKNVEECISILAKANDAVGFMQTPYKKLADLGFVSWDEQRFKEILKRKSG